MPYDANNNDSCVVRIKEPFSDDASSKSRLLAEFIRSGKKTSGFSVDGILRLARYLRVLDSTHGRILAPEPGKGVTGRRERERERERERGARKEGEKR